MTNVGFCWLVQIAVDYTRSQLRSILSATSAPSSISHSAWQPRSFLYPDSQSIYCRQLKPTALALDLLAFASG